jgi:PTS system nitrogen regulatory IIA component
MNQIAKLLPPDDVVVGLEASSKKRVFEQAGLLFENKYGISRAAVYEALFEREKIGSTGLGHGIAVPHGRISGLKEARGAFLRLATPVQFDAPDGKPAEMIFVLLVPESASKQQDHLNLLAALAEQFSNRAFREKLAAATDAATIHALFAACPD